MVYTCISHCSTWFSLVTPLIESITNIFVVNQIFRYNGVFKDPAIDPMQNLLPLNNSFVRIQNRDNKFFTIFVSKPKASEANLNTNKRII